MPKAANKIKKQLARSLYLQGLTIAEIAAEVDVTTRALYKWRDAGQWDDLAPPDTAEQSIARRINILIERENKTEAELAELIALTKSLGDMRINLAIADKLQAEASAIKAGHYIPPGTVPNYDAAGYHPDAGQPIAPGQPTPTSNKKTKPGSKRKKAIKNDISEITPEQLDDLRDSLFFDYQLLWYARKQDPATRRNRFILKSRQIGATYYFAFEALDDAIRTGDNQIFLSASRDQAEVFKAYIISFAYEHFGVELKGQGVIKLSNGAELRFLSTNSRTAQSYNGHLYLDEVFWIPDFNKMWKVASGMASQKKWRRTLFSTPSTMSHQAYPMWCGDKYNEHRAESKQAEFDLTHATLQSGQLGADKIWRHLVTVEDAEAQGCNLFDIDELRTEYSPRDFANLFMCVFINDADSVFKLADLLNCMTDQTDWPDYHPKAARPFGNRPVAIGYDPSRTRDNASLVVMAIPLEPGEPWRVLQHLGYQGQNFQYQANRIKDIVDTHNVKHIGIDVTGIGYGVFELVEQFYRRVTPITYSLQTKTELVIKALDVVTNKRLQYSAGDKEITQALLMITQTSTGSGAITYAANRSNTTGHADVAWSIMHALNYEPIAPRKKTTASFSKAA